MMIEVGQAVTDTATFTLNGVATDPGAIHVTTTDPAGGVLTYVYGTDPQVVRDGTGIYHLVVPMGIAGQWRVQWTGTAPVPAEITTAYYVYAGEAAKPLVITPQELSSYMRRSFTPEDVGAATQIIEMLQDELEIRLHRKLSVRSIAEVHLLPRDSTRIFLYETPVVAIQSVSVGGSDLDPTTWLLTSTYGELDISAYLSMPYDWFAVGEAQLAVNYTAGVDGLNYPGIKAAMLRAAGREMLAAMEGVQGLNRLSVEGTSMSYGSTRSGKGLQGFTDEEIASLGRLKRRVVAI